MFLYKSDFHWQGNAFLWFDFQTRGFTYQGRNASSQCSAPLRLNGEKKKLPCTLGLFISAMSHVKLIMETRVYICHKNMKSIGFFTVFIQKYSTYYRKWIDFETATITSDHVSTT